MIVKLRSESRRRNQDWPADGNKLSTRDCLNSFNGMGEALTINIVKI